MAAVYRVDFPAASLGVEIGPSSWEGLIQRPDVFAAIPAPPFGERGPEFLLRDAARQVQIASRRPGEGVAFCVAPEGTTARRGGNPTRGCTVAVQAFAPLVEAGAVVAPDAVDYAPRTAIVLRRDGGLTFAASRGATSREFAEELAREVNAVWAATTMVGPESAIVTRQGVLFGPQDAAASAWLVARRPGVSPTRMAAPQALPEMVPASRAIQEVPRSVPTEARGTAAPALNSEGNGDELKIVLGLGLLAAAVWYAQEKR